VDKLEIQWSNGNTEIFNVPAVDKVMTITQSQGK